MDQSPGSTIIAHFAAFTDPRVDRTKERQLLDILTIALCAIISGVDEWVAMEAFGKAKREWFDTFLRLPNGIPSHDTFGRARCQIGVYPSLMSAIPAPLRQSRLFIPVS